MASSESRLRTNITNLISSKQAVCFTVSNCENCRLAESKLKDLKLDVGCVCVDTEGNKDEYKNVLNNMTNHSTFPFVFINGQFIGGWSELSQKLESGMLQPLISGSAQNIPVS
jgi:glutaredoxin 3